MQYLRARYYDPTSGRFTRLDPFFGNLEDPLSLHKYGYVHGDPVQGVDPTGWYYLNASMAWAFLPGPRPSTDAAEAYLAAVANAIAFSPIGDAIEQYNAIQDFRQGRTADGLIRSALLASSFLGVFAASIRVAGGRAILALADDAVETAAATRRVANSFSLVRTPSGRRVYQRSDIDWDFVHPAGRKTAGLTNREASRRGYAPLRMNPATGRVDGVALHHANDEPFGALIETHRSTHTRFHNTMSRENNPWRKEHPEWVRDFNDERGRYWKWRASQV